jgi:hypothetical protein
MAWARILYSLQHEYRTHTHLSLFVSVTRIFQKPAEINKGEKEKKSEKDETVRGKENTLEYDEKRKTGGIFSALSPHFCCAFLIIYIFFI